MYAAGRLAWRYMVSYVDVHINYLIIIILYDDDDYATATYSMVLFGCRWIFMVASIRGGGIHKYVMRLTVMRLTIYAGN